MRVSANDRAMLPNKSFVLAKVAKVAKMADKLIGHLAPGLRFRRGWRTGAETNGGSEKK
jgi:hypothetical protein